MLRNAKRFVKFRRSGGPPRRGWARDTARTGVYRWMSVIVRVSGLVAVNRSLRIARRECLGMSGNVHECLFDRGRGRRERQRPARGFPSRSRRMRSRNDSFEPTRQFSKMGPRTVAKLELTARYINAAARSPDCTETSTPIAALSPSLSTRISLWTDRGIVSAAHAPRSSISASQSGRGKRSKALNAGDFLCHARLACRLPERARGSCGQ